MAIFKNTYRRLDMGFSRVPLGVDERRIRPSWGGNVRREERLGMSTVGLPAITTTQPWALEGRCMIWNREPRACDVWFSTEGRL